MGKKIYADLSSLEKLLKTPLVGSISDTYSYLTSAYGYYKNLLPIVEINGKNYFITFRFLSSIVFVPFMWLFGGYFPLAYIVFFTFSVLFLYVLLLETLRIKPLIIIFTLLLISPLIFYHIPRLMLEGPTIALLLSFLVLFFKGKLIFSIFPLILASFIRGEIAIVLLIFGIYLLLKTKNPFFLISFVPITLQAFMNMYLGDQSNFYFWTYKAYLQNVKGVEYSNQKVQNCVQKKLGFIPEKILQGAYPYSKISTDCLKEVLKDEIKLKDLGIAIKNIFTNIINLLLYFPNRILKFLPKIFLIFYIIYNLFVLVSIIFYFLKGFRILLILYFSLIFAYSLYNPFGFFDFSRFKQMLIPFEIVFIFSLASKYHLNSLLKR